MTLLFLLATAFTLNQVNGYGFVTPTGPIYTEVNSTITIGCTIDLNDPNTEGLNSSYLSFKLSNGEQYERTADVQILNETSIELTIPNAEPQLLLATCYLKSSGVDAIRINIGYKPMPVNNFECISSNWQNMKCTFEKSSNPISSQFNLTYSIDRNSPHRNVCILGGDYNRTYWCKMDFSSIQSVYRQHYSHYYFTLISTNPLGELIENFTIDHFRIVIPDPVENLVTRNITPDSAVVQWNIPYQLITFPRNLIHLINYTSEFSNGVWKQLYMTSYQQLTNQIVLKDLEFANVWYDVRVSIQVQNASYDNMWSNFTFTTFRTLSRIPDEPPNIDSGGFNVDDNGNIYLYWREIAKSKKNGNNPTYNITIESGAPQSIRPNITTNTMAKFDRMTSYMHNDLVFHIRSANDEGNSIMSSVIVVPKTQRRLKHPMHFKKILHDRKYHLSWNPPAFSDDIQSYTVFWCVTKNEFLNQCDGSIDFQRVSRYVTNFTHLSNETLNFAVAANSRVSSSGMIWARCTAGSINDIGKLSTIWIAKIESTAIQFKWTLECVDQTIVNGYNLSYCPINDPKTVSCKENSERYINITKSDSLGYTLTDLIPYTTYKTVVSMYSSQRVLPGPPSEPLINTTLEAAPSPPRNLYYTNVTDTSVTLHWEIPEFINGVLMKYKVWSNAHVTEVDKPHFAPNMTYTLTGLNSYTTYDILVTASTVADSNRSNTVTIQTKVGKPGNIAQPTINADGFFVTWEPPAMPNGQVQYYQVKVINKIGNKEEEHISTTRGTKCTYNFKKCDLGVDVHSFSVRAVNVVSTPFDKKRISQHDIDSSRLVCKEENDNDLKEFIDSDKHATTIPGNYSPPIQLNCNQSEYATGGWYMLWTLISLTGVVVACVSVVMMRKFKNMKDISVELPAGLEDIKEEANSKGLTLDYSINPRQDSTRQNHYSTVPNEQEQSLLRNRMESGSSNSTDNSSGHCEYNEAVDDSESEQQNDEESTAQTLSESIDMAKSSPTPLLPASKLPPIKKDPIIMPAINHPAITTIMPLTSNNYIAESFLRSSPAAPQPLNGYVSHDAIASAMPSTGYTSWNAAVSRPMVRPVDETKFKTPVVATTDIQGISGYVTHKQLSDFGQLIQ